MPRVWIGKSWTGFVLTLTLAMMLSLGCYREPTHPAQRGPHGGADMGMSMGDMPNDNIHGGLGGAPGQPGAIIQSREVELGPMVLVAPDEWIRREPSSQFLITEFSLGKAEGDAEDGRLTVSSAGGSIEDNIARWKRQFGDQPEHESQETVDLANTQAIVVDLSGTYNNSPLGGMAPGTDMPGYRMIAAVIPLEGQQFFIKAYGPAKTIAAHEARIGGFIRSLRPRSSAAEARQSDTP